MLEKKGRDLTQSYDKSPYTDRKIKKQRDNTKTPPKTSITQRLQTDLGRSVRVTIATQLVWLNQFTGSQPSHSPQQFSIQYFNLYCICHLYLNFWGFGQSYSLDITVGIAYVAFNPSDSVDLISIYFNFARFIWFLIACSNL